MLHPNTRNGTRLRPPRRPSTARARGRSSRPPRPIGPGSVVAGPRQILRPVAAGEAARLGSLDSTRVTFLSATDDEALNAFQLWSKLEGIIPALEPAHAIAKVLELAPQKPTDHLMVLNLSGRGDKDLASVAEHLGSEFG